MTYLCVHVTPLMVQKMFDIIPKRKFMRQSTQHRKTLCAKIWGPHQRSFLFIKGSYKGLLYVYIIYIYIYTYTGSMV